MQIKRLPSFLAPEVFPYASVTIVPATECVAPYVDVTIIPVSEGPIVDVALGHILDEADLEAVLPIDDDEQPDPYDDGSGCTVVCGYCGRCN